MTAILQKFPFFTEVSVTDDDEGERDDQHAILSPFIAVFTISNSTPTAMMLPHITKICFACERADAVIFPLFLDMLESRWKVSNCALGSTELVFFGYPIEPDSRSLARIKKLQGAGLRITLLFGHNARHRVGQWLYNIEWT
ncbi:hypothetical protein MSAN_01195700 [Mycena sanguinolenta]|uniref:Uncharacterized protein n=1 Tax=Mycena sanguinolenta TaxID=230812 RepID=A0A8H6YGI3_9AGAR|nr:hypothetical protein MSAN_01195700 [Mycena sanguinolenta]